MYEVLLRWAILCFSAKKVMAFLGRQLRGNFQGEVRTEYRDRWPGARIKHTVNRNWIKRYDKFGGLLRVETVINNPREFRVRRQGTRRGQTLLGWFPMAQGVSHLYRYAEVSLQANQNHRSALAEVDTSSLEAAAQMRRAAAPVRRRGRSYRGFNPASTADVAGDGITYTIRVTNPSHITLTGVSVTDQVESYPATSAVYVSGDNAPLGQLNDLASSFNPQAQA